MLNIYMKDVYVNAFYNVVQETQLQTGLELPKPIEAYVVMLLAYHVDLPNFLPDKSFAESYLALSQSSSSAKELGDTCLFVSGVFPMFGSKKGLPRSYYQEIGISSYEQVSGTLNGELFSTLSTHFVFVSDFIEETIHSSKHLRNTLFR